MVMIVTRVIIKTVSSPRVLLCVAGDPSGLGGLAVDTGGVVAVLQLPLPAPAPEAGHGPGRRHLAVLGAATGLAPGVAQLPGHGSS